MCPEHKVRSKSYTVTITIDEEKSEIKEAQCFDCAASSGEIYSFNFNFEKSLNTSNKNIHLRSEK